MSNIKIFVAGEVDEEKITLPFDDVFKIEKHVRLTDCGTGGNAKNFDDLTACSITKTAKDLILQNR